MGQLILPSVSARYLIALCTTEMGAFTEGISYSEESIRIANSAAHPISLARVYNVLGFIYLCKGEHQKGLAIFERCLELCQDEHLPTDLSITTSYLGYAYALTGRFAKALPLIEQEVDQDTASLHALWPAQFSEAKVLAGRLDEASDLAKRALDLARTRQERGREVYALRILGDIAMHRHPPEMDQAKIHYQQALVQPGKNSLSVENMVQQVAPLNPRKRSYQFSPEVPLMPGPKPITLPLSARQQAILQGLTRRPTSPQRLVYRAKIILAAAQGQSHEHIAQELGLSRLTVRTWRRRWHAALEDLAEAEAAGADDKVMRARIEALLGDAPRPGTPGTFSAEQLTQIISVACESPQDCGRPVTHWTPRELAQEVIKRGMVESISVRTVGRFLKRSRSQAASLALLAQP